MVCGRWPGLALKRVWPIEILMGRLLPKRVEVFELAKHGELLGLQFCVGWELYIYIYRVLAGFAEIEQRGDGCFFNALSVKWIVSSNVDGRFHGPAQDSACPGLCGGVPGGNLSKISFLFLLNWISASKSTGVWWVSGSSFINLHEIGGASLWTLYLRVFYNDNVWFVSSQFSAFLFMCLQFDVN